MNPDIAKRSVYSNERLDLFKKYIHGCKELESQESFCIYATGSYGRLEAAEHSDLDLFFLSDQENSRFSKISKILIDADIIRASREMGLPEFSGDGEYLETHNVKDIYSELGSRKDDFQNFFSARMLLLLESRPVFNSEKYNEILETTIDKYYIDFHEHVTDFKPVFLINDVIRFWRTMCLNYEHNRNRKFICESDQEKIVFKKNEVHIKNLKLKFSRKLTCYSFLLSVLCSDKQVLAQSDIMEMIKKTPLQRLESLTINREMESKVSEIISLYLWFLNTSQQNKEKLVEWISDTENRKFAFDKSREFAKLIFELMIETKNKERLMYFLV